MLGYLFLTILGAVARRLLRRPGARPGASRRAGARRVHSLPSYHGAFVAIWVGVPALILVLLWLLFQDSVIDGLLLAQPARRA